MRNKTGLKGIVTVDLYRNDVLISREIVCNLVTDSGDSYYAQKAIAGISPANPSAPSAATGMKLGTGSTAAAKSGAGAALGAYVSGSNKAFDSSYPSVNEVGSDVGWEAVYRTTWAAGEGTSNDITEAVIVNDAGSNLTSSAANTYSRVTFGALDKTADDSLVITWRHTFLGE